jgi:hypothetical protein
VTNSILEWRDIVIENYGSIENFPDVHTVNHQLDAIRKRLDELDFLLSIDGNHQGAITHDHLMDIVKEINSLLLLKYQLLRRLVNPPRKVRTTGDQE